MNKGESYCQSIWSYCQVTIPFPFLFTPIFYFFLKTSSAPPKSFKKDEFAKLTALTKIYAKLTGGAVAKLTNNFD